MLFSEFPNGGAGLRSVILCILLVLAAVMLVAGCGGDTASTASLDTVADTSTAPSAVTAQTPVPFTQSPAAPPPEEQPLPYGSGTTSPQTVGTLIDGLQLSEIRWGDHGAYFRIVFDMGTPDGQPVMQVPHAEASMSADHKQINVVLGGIRSIGTSENVTSSDLDVGDSLVMSIKRLPAKDDQSLTYAIELSRPAVYSLAGLGSPGRIVIDINKG